MKQISPFLLIVVLALFASSIQADVTQISDAGFVSEHTLTLKGSPAEVYRALTADIHRWWNAEHSYSGEAGNFSLDAMAGGCFCEKLAAGGSVEHLRVVFAEPGKRLRLIGGLGPLQALAVSGSMDFSLSPADEGQTTLHYRYVVGGYTPGGLKAMAEPVDRVQLGQLLRLQKFLATSAPIDQAQ